MNGTGRWSLILCLPILAAAVVVGCDHEETGSLAHPGRPECPHDWDFKRGQLPAVGPVADIPEYNDCQRFIVEDGGERRYDELYAIFAILDDTTRALAAPDMPMVREQTIDNAVLMDTAGVMDSSSASDTLQQIRVSQGNDTIAVAEIYAEGQYEPLGIASVFSCLILTGPGPRWSARMVPVVSAEVDCREVRPDSGKILTVHTVEVASHASPLVARWDWDDDNGKQYMIVRCGRTMWCEVGDSDLLPTSPPSADPGLPATRYVKGWYDQQYLATTDEDGRTVPTRILGTIYPDTDLDQRNAVAEFERPMWVPVSRVSLEVPENPTALELQALDDYKANLNFVPTKPGAGQDPDGRLNTIYLRQGDLHTVLPATLTAADQERVAECPASQWWAMIVSAETPPDTVYRCVTRREHPSGFHVPGTARWRWLASDETTWQRCPQGCCELPQ